MVLQLQQVSRGIEDWMLEVDWVVFVSNFKDKGLPYSIVRTHSECLLSFILVSVLAMVICITLLLLLLVLLPLFHKLRDLYN